MIEFKYPSQLPKFTEKGFAVVDLPEDIKHLLFDFYALLKPHSRQEEGIVDMI
jgi:hypothetical protein